MTERTQLLRSLPVAGSGCGDVRFVTNGYDLVVEYEYHPETAGGDLVGAIIFNGVSAFRFRDEMHSAGFCHESFDAVVEIVDSEWHRQLLQIEPTGILGTVESKRHFAIFFSSNGYFEVIADCFEALPEREGPLVWRAP